MASLEFGSRIVCILLRLGRSFSRSRVLPLINLSVSTFQWFECNSLIISGSGRAACFRRLDATQPEREQAALPDPELILLEWFHQHFVASRFSSSKSSSAHGRMSAFRTFFICRRA